MLDTPPPTPPFRLPYPVHLVREGKEVLGSDPPGLTPGQSPGLTPIRLLGVASPPVDVIREEVALPPLQEGDVLVFAQAGAYLRTGLFLEEWGGTMSEVVLGKGGERPRA